ncbi:hypothetical protein [Pedobacter cryophilus]|uniref:Uncharacterized protein n=1 Tax=Pedobacter cryophilus TaxID=2571271 RepID=A0A4U1C1Q5_9SPHI|nr:hypothetical protein [Pedobacter cryophilus]TKB97007.1 hypothetical protein FA046_13125 [Pedobacter cryophilus]
MFPQLDNYLQLWTKLEYDIKKYKETNHIFELLNCIMTLNSFPEWIDKSQESSNSLKETAREKIKIMKGLDGFIFDESKLDSDIDQKLRFIRLICNHSKHKTDSELIPIIKSKWGTSFPSKFPGKFCNIIAIGEKEIDAEHLINSVAEFWKNRI